MAIKLNKNKKGFAFTMFAFFLVFIIFAFGSLYLFQGDFTRDSEFKEARILYVNDEIVYFKDTYLQNALSYSLYTTFGSLLDYLNTTNKFSDLHLNYEKLNALVFEGITNGSFNGVAQNSLKNASLTFFTNSFKSAFDSNYLGNFTFEIINMSLFEERSYYISAQMIVNYSVEMNDNISSWNFVDEFVVSVPVFDLNDPEFLIQGNLEVPVKAAEFHLASMLWSNKNFNDTLTKTYSVIYYDEEHEYTIGSSYLGRLLNKTQGGYLDVLGSWSFDNDDGNEGVHDSSLFNSLGSHYGNSILLLNFENETKGDLSAYKSEVTLNGVTWEKNDCMVEGCFEFDGIDDNIIINNVSDNLNGTKVLTLSYWAKFNEMNGDDLGSNYTRLMGITGNFDGGDGSWFVIDMTEDKLQLEGGVSGCSITTSINHTAELSIFNNYVITTDVESGITSYYLNGDLLENKSFTSCDGGFNVSGFDFEISNAGSNFFINGSLDELAVYSKVVSDVEAAEIYNEKFVKHIDYVETIFGKGIKFDGLDDYVEINKTEFITSQFSTSVWFKLLDYPNISIDDESLIMKDPYVAIKSGSNKIRIYNYGLENYSATMRYYEGNEPVKLNKWYNVVTTYDGDLNDYAIYINGKLDYLNDSVGHPGNSGFRIDKIGGEPGTSGGRYFNGIIDEVRVYNRTLSENEITMNYRNYDGFEKGCCNYVQIVNPTKFGYTDDTIYNEDISYSSRLFYNRYSRGKVINPNIELYNLTNYTSYDNSTSYYNLKLDSCLVSAYNVFDWDSGDNSIAYHTPVLGNVVGSHNCEKLVELGYY